MLDGLSTLTQLTQNHLYLPYALGLPAQTTEVEIVFARQPGWAEDEYGFPELLAIARSARDLVGGVERLAPRI